MYGRPQPWHGTSTDLMHAIPVYTCLQYMSHKSITKSGNQRGKCVAIHAWANQLAVVGWHKQHLSTSAEPCIPPAMHTHNYM